MIRYVTYSRYSSDGQSKASIADQQRKCREYANREGWHEVRAYSDKAQSGVGSDRAEFQRLIALACSPARDFDVILTDDTSRLSRSLPDVVNLYQKLAHHGVRVIAVSQGIDTDHEQSEILIAMHGITDSLYVKELAKKTHRGLEGRVLHGLSAGGRCFGYTSVPQGSGGVKWVINPDEAKIVVEIFELSAAGNSLKGIAGLLNARLVPPPQKRKDRPHATWCPTAIREILRRELYIGQRIWNQRKFLKTPGTNKRVSRPRPQSEWRIQEIPELRIISDDLWSRVQTRQNVLKEIYAASGRKPVNRAASSAYLFSGFLRCGSCGANLIIVSGGGRGARYGCPQHWNRKACSNRITIRSTEVEAQLLAGLQNEVLTDDAVDFVVDHMLDAAQKREAKNQRETKIRELEAEVKKLVAAIAKVEDPDEMIAALNERKAEIRSLKAAKIVGADLSEHDIRTTVREALSDIPKHLRKAPEQAKAKLSQHLSEIKMIPQSDGSYLACGEWDLLGVRGPVMVAGGGFEPPTFGL
ncbi:MAG: recombinase family protein [Acidobacteriota bacterium]